MARGDRSMSRNPREFMYTKKEKEHTRSIDPEHKNSNTYKMNQYNKKMDEQQRQLRYELKDNSMQPKREKSYNDKGYSRENDRFNDSVNQRERAADRRRNNAYAREEAAFNRGRNPELDRLDAARRHNRYKADKAQRDAQNAVGRNNPTPSRNPTASGDGSREWEDHKYIDKVQTKTGKIRYIYDVETSSGRHDSSTKPIGPNELKRAKEELDKAKTGLTKPTQKNLLAISQKKSGERNTGGSDKYHNPIKDTAEKARRLAYQAGEAVNNATKSAAKAASDGASFVTKKLSDAVSSTPLKDLFK